MRCRTALKRAACWLAAAATIAVWAPAYAQEAFQQGLDAYLQGDYEKARELWLPVAESGNEVAAFNIGVLYAQGLGVAADPVEAVRWYRRSALAGYSNAQFNLGSAYYNSQGTEKNVAQAVSWWERAAEQDHPEALYNLGTLYRRGQGVQRDVARARSLLERAAARGDNRAGQALENLRAEAGQQAEQQPPQQAGSTAGETAAPQSAPSDPAPAGGSLATEDPARWTVQVIAGTDRAAVEEFAREHGLRDGMRIYQAEVDGKRWFKGIYGSYENEAEARRELDGLQSRLPGSQPWARSFRAIQAEAIGEVAAPPARAAEAPPPEQPAAVEEEPGPAPEPPEKTEQPKKVTHPKKKTEEEEKAPAAQATASAEPNPETEPPDPDEPGQADATAQEEAPKVAKASTGDQSALFKGQQAFNAQKYKRAFDTWHPLADKGIPEAQYGVAFMYESGWGVERDYAEAFRWYQLAAEQGHVKSQFNLGMLYRNGQGVAQNDALGLYWIQTAADGGDGRALDFLKNLN